MALTPEQQSLRDRFLASGSTWSDAWERVLLMNPSHFAAYMKLHEASFQGSNLPLKYMYLFCLAADASCCTNYNPGMKAHIAAALAAGASPAEVMETLELTSVLGIHSVNCGVPLLHEVLQEEGLPARWTPEQKWNDRQQQLKDTFTATRGYWHPGWDPVLALDPDFLEAYTAYSGEGWKKGSSLPPKIKEMVYISIDSASTHMFLPGLKLHIKNAVRYGATADEIMVVLKLANLIGMHTMLEGTAYLTELQNGQS